MNIKKSLKTISKCKEEGLWIWTDSCRGDLKYLRREEPKGMCKPCSRTVSSPEGEQWAGDQRTL